MQKFLHKRNLLGLKLKGSLVHLTVEKRVSKLPVTEISGVWALGKYAVLQQN